MKIKILTTLFVFATSLLCLSISVKADEVVTGPDGNPTVIMNTITVTTPRLPAPPPPPPPPPSPVVAITISIGNGSGSSGGGPATGGSGGNSSLPVASGTTPPPLTKQSNNCDVIFKNKYSTDPLVSPYGSTQYDRVLSNDVTSGVYIQKITWSFNVTNSGTLASVNINGGTVYGNTQYTFYEAFDANNPNGIPTDQWTMPPWGPNAAGTVSVSSEVRYYPTATMADFPKMQRHGAVLPNSSIYPALDLPSSNDAPDVWNNDPTPSDYAATGKMVITFPPPDPSNPHPYILEQQGKCDDAN